MEAVVMADDKALVTQVTLSEAVERVLIKGDLKELEPEQRVEYYHSVCKSLGLNPLTRPFGYIVLNNKLTLYALKDAAEQLRRINGVSITKLEKDFNANGLYVVTAYAQDKYNRTDVSTGAVNSKGLAGDALANAIMKAETKAKRRVTLSICGLGWLDETEIETIKDAKPVVVTETGDIIEAEVKASASPNGTAPSQPEPTKPIPPTPTPVTTPEPEQVSELDKALGRPSITEQERLQQAAQAKPGTAKFWDGGKWVEKPADENIKLATGTWFSQHFMGEGKAFENTYALFGQPSQKDVAKRGHLGKHYGRTDFVNPKSAMTWREFSELVAYAWWQQGDKEHGTLSLPRYQDKLAEELKNQDAIPYDEPTKSVVPTSANVVEERAKKFGVDILTLAQAAFSAELIPQLSSATERQLQTLWQVLDAVELGNVKADDFDGQLEMIMLN